MTIGRAGIWAAAVGLMAAACVTITPKPAPEPECRVAGLEVGAAIRAADDLFELEAPQNFFPPGTAKVYALVRLTDIPGALRMRWKWYGPDGRLVRDSLDVPANAEGLYLEVLTAFDRLDLGPPDAAPAAGTWQVVFFLDGRLAARRSFVLEAASLPRPGFF
jgi:hypothetical protein